MEIKVGGHYKLLKKIDSGSFGEIYKGLNTKTNTEVAVKLENLMSKYPQLLMEAKIMQHLLNDSTVADKGIPQVYHTATEGEFSLMVMELLGPSLESLFNQLGKRFTLKTTLMLADRMIRRVEYVHSKGFVHRDIKPDNFLIGAGTKSNRLYLIDFGLSKRYLVNGKHIKYEEGKSLTGTARYASLNTHLGIEPTRRDDMESIFFCMAYFLLGILPWQNLKAETKEEKYKRIMEKKMEYRPELLCKNLASELLQMLQHIRTLRYDEKPNYDLLRNLIKECMNHNNIENNNYFDWDKLE